MIPALDIWHYLAVAYLWGGGGIRPWLLFDKSFFHHWKKLENLVWSLPLYKYSSVIDQDYRIVSHKWLLDMESGGPIKRLVLRWGTGGIWETISQHEFAPCFHNNI